jgi:hypothetical protein
MFRVACLLSLAALALAALAAPAKTPTSEPEPQKDIPSRPNRLRVAATGELMPTFYAQFSLN